MKYKCIFVSHSSKGSFATTYQMSENIWKEAPSSCNHDIQGGSLPLFASLTPFHPLPRRLVLYVIKQTTHLWFLCLRTWPKEAKSWVGCAKRVFIAMVSIFFTVLPKNQVEKKVWQRWPWIPDKKKGEFFRGKCEAGQRGKKIGTILWIPAPSEKAF